MSRADWTLGGVIAAMVLLATLFSPGAPPKALLPARGAADAAIVWSDAGALIDINRADEALLRQLPGIGETLAGRILSDRAANGPYESLEALGRVRGIGPAKIGQIAPRATAVLPPRASSFTS